MFDRENGLRVQFSEESREALKSAKAWALTLISDIEKLESASSSPMPLEMLQYHIGCVVRDVGYLNERIEGFEEWEEKLQEEQGK